MNRATRIRPQLKIYADGIAFAFPATAERPADRIASDIRSAQFGLPLMTIAGIGLLVCALFADDPNLGLGLLIAGGLAIVMATSGAIRIRYVVRHRHSLIQQALDQLPVALCVENARLIRRFASDREIVWPRDKIENVQVLTLTETVGDSENSSVITYCELTLQLRDGLTEPLYQRATPDTNDAFDLYWMAEEIRRALCVPYDAPPVPIDGAVLERLANGIEVRVPHTDPEQAWHHSCRDWLALGGTLVVFLGIVFIVFAIAAFFDEAGGRTWQDALFIFLSMCVMAAIFGSLALIEYFNRTSVVAEFADRTPIAVGVRPGLLYRKYASGREETWPVAEIAAIAVLPTPAKPTSPLGVYVQLKQGTPVHLHGNVNQIPGSKLQEEGLRWLADELGKALGLITEVVKSTTPVTVEDAFVDFAARPAVETNIVRTS